jgi:hypothetical protein
MRISKIPVQYREEFFEELLEQRGQRDSKLLIEQDADLIGAICWITSKKGHEYWANINSSINPRSEQEKPKDNKLKDLIKEAKKRGFKTGAMTKFGEVTKGYEHELLSNGDFFFRNIKAYSNGVWIEVKNSSNEKDEYCSAIHTMLDDMFRNFGKN